MLDARGEESHAAQPTTDGKKRGRPVKPVEGYGPFAQYARRMREAREAPEARECDRTPSYQVMAQRVASNHNTLSKADSGAPVSWEHCELYLKSVNVAPADLPTWRTEHDHAVRRAALFHPDLSGVADRPALRARLRSLMAAEGVDDATLLARRAEAEQHAVPAGLSTPVPDAKRLRGARPLPRLLPRRWTDDETLWAVHLAGGTTDDVAHWRTRLAALPAEPPPWRDRRVIVPALAATAVLGLAAVLVVALVGGVAALRRDGGPGGRTGVAASAAPPGETLTPVPPPQAGVGGGGPATNELDGIIAGIDPAQPSAGDHAHVDMQITAYGPPPGYPDKVSDVTEQLDWSPHAPGRVVVYGSGAASTPKPLPSGPPLGAAGPPTADPTELQRILEQRRRSGSGTAALMLGVADLCATYPLRAAEQIAVLRMLRDAPGVGYQGEVIVERLGVNGKAFSADGPGGTRETLVVDPGSGRLLVHESTIQRPDGGHVTTRRVVFVRASWDGRPD